MQSLKAFDTRGILRAPAGDVHVRLKTTGKAILKNYKRHYQQSIKEIKFGETFTETTIFSHEDKY